MRYERIAELAGHVLLEPGDLLLGLAVDALEQALAQVEAVRRDVEAKISTDPEWAAARARVAEITSQAQREHNVSATPTFMINGQIAEGAGTWATLEPKLREAM